MKKNIFNNLLCLFFLVSFSEISFCSEAQKVINFDFIAKLSQMRDEAQAIIQDRKDLSSSEIDKIKNIYIATAIKANALIEGIILCLRNDQDCFESIKFSYKELEENVKKLNKEYKYHKNTSITTDQEKSKTKEFVQQSFANAVPPVNPLGIGIEFLGKILEYIFEMKKLEKEKIEKNIKQLERLKWSLKI